MTIITRTLAVITRPVGDRGWSESQYNGSKQIQWTIITRSVTITGCQCLAHRQEALLGSCTFTSSLTIYLCFNLRLVFNVHLFIILQMVKIQFWNNLNKISKKCWPVPTLQFRTLFQALTGVKLGKWNSDSGWVRSDQCKILFYIQSSCENSKPIKRLHTSWLHPQWSQE